MFIHLAPGKGIGLLGKLIGAVCHLAGTPGKALPEAAIAGGRTGIGGNPLIGQDLLCHISGISQFGGNLLFAFTLADSLVKKLLIVPDNVLDLINSQLSPQRRSQLRDILTSVHRFPHLSI